MIAGENKKEREKEKELGSARSTGFDLSSGQANG
jgi:hypothetical protein